MLSRVEYRQLDAVGLAQLVREKQMKPIELLETVYREVDLLNPALNAVVCRNDTMARAEAGAVSHTLPLAGVPFPAKDINVEVQGLPLKHACRFFDEAPASKEDSLLARRWRDAGLVVFGRTNTPEFATNYGCEPEYYGATNNPWDVNLTTGGSSGGAAAAVAAGIVPLAHASDSGGSIRVPAACCGVFGFKPTSGLVSTGSHLGPLVNGLNCDHAVSWTVRDSAALLDATAGPDVGAPRRFCPDEGGYLAQLDRSPGRLTVGMVAQSPTGFEPDQEMVLCLEAAAKLLSDLGHTVVSWRWPDNCDACDAAVVFWANELTVLVEEYAQALGRAPKRQELGSVVHWAMEQAHNTSSVDVARAQAQLIRLQRSMAVSMDGIDVILSPVVTGPPPVSGILTEAANTDIATWTDLAWRFAPYTEIFNVTGQPAMSVPLFQSQAGLPIGMHFAGRVGQDLPLMQLARQLETALPWHDRRPPEPVRQTKTDVTQPLS